MARDKTTLTNDEVEGFLKKHKEWKVANQQLERTFEFSAFPDGIAFVQAVATLAQRADHHPDIDIRFTKVTLKLSTHDAGGLTSKDTALAAQVDDLRK